MLGVEFVPTTSPVSRSFTGHVNEKNFVGLATDGDYVTCGSENNGLYVYYKVTPEYLHLHNVPRAVCRRWNMCFLT